MKRVCVILPLCLIVAGCAWFEPRSKASFNPLTRGFSFYTSQEQGLEVEGAEFWHNDLERGSGAKIAKLAFRNESARVLEALEKTMLAFTKQQEMANQGIGITLTGLQGLLSDARGLLSELKSLKPGSAEPPCPLSPTNPLAGDGGDQNVERLENGQHIGDYTRE